MRNALTLPPGISADGTSHSTAGRWVDGSNVRFNDEGQAEVIGGWESVVPTLLTGVCRNVLPWTDNLGTLTLGLGTHSNLQLWQGGLLADVTPTLARPSATLGANPLAVVNATPTVTVTHPNHGLATADTIIVSGAASVGGIAPNGTFAITVTGSDTYTFTFGSNATSTATGGGSAVVVAPQNPFTAGQINGTGSAGYGTGGYGVGGYGQPSATDYFPRTWSMAAWGQQLLACPRGGTIYAWTNNLGAPAAPLANAPREATHMLVSGTRQVFALGTNEESSGRFNPLCIRHSSVGLNTEWTTGTATTAREYILPGGGRIVAGRLIGDRMFVWTTDALFQGSYVGNLTQPWSFTRVAKGSGLIGPNAAVVVGQTAFWVTPDLQFMSCNLGGVPSPISCPIHSDFADNLAASQSDKIVASGIGSQGEIRIDYPDARDGIENSRYLLLKVSGPKAGVWSRGIMDRTAMVDAGPSSYPCGATADGHLYWHERGHSADGGVLSWFIETGDQMLSEDASIRIAGMWADFKNQQGPISVTLTSRFKPNGPAVVKGPYAVAATDDKTDMRAYGRYFRIRFSGASAPAFARIGEPVFDTRPGGQR